MPFYNYTCECGHVQTNMAKFSEREENKKCESCGKDAVYTPFVPGDKGTVIFKGRWYKNNKGY